MSTGWKDLNFSPYSFSSPARQSIRWRHSGEPYRRQLFRDSFEVGDVFEAVLFRRLLQRADRVGAGERGRFEGDEAFLFEFFVRLFPRFGGVGGHFFGFEAEERGQGRAGVLRVARDRTGLDRFVGDRFGAEAEVALDLVAGRGQGLGVDFPEDFLFGEVLRADRQADLAVFGVGDDRAGAVAFFGFGRAAVVLLLPQAVTPRPERARAASPRLPQPRLAWILTVVPPCVFVGQVHAGLSFRPFEVSRRCSPASENSSARASRATRIAPASTPLVP